MKRTGLFLALALVAATPLTSQNGWNGDAETCYQATKKIKPTDGDIAACTRAIQSAQLSEGSLANTYDNRGIAWGDRGEYDKAIADFSEALRIHPNYAEAYNGRGIAWENKGDYDKAIADYGRALHVNPDFANAYNNRGSVWNRKGEYDKAISDFNKALRIDANDAPAYYNRGNAWSHKGECDKAIADFSEALRINPNYAGAFNNRGFAWNQKGEYDRAISDFDAALRINSKYVSALVGRGVVWNAKGEYDKAIADFQSAIGIDSSNSYSPLLLAIAQMHKGQEDIATDLRRESATLRSDWPLPIVQFYLGQMSESALTDAAKDTDPQKEKVRLCNLHYYLGEWQLFHALQLQGIANLKEALAGCPKSLIEYGAAQAELNRAESAGAAAARE